MASIQKLSLFEAILININIMLGSGIFINTTVLTEQAGGLAPFSYLLVGVLLLPLIMTIAQLLHYHQESGTFYDFGRSISPFFGFVSSWSYFIGKLCSVALGVHVSLSFLQTLFPALQTIPLIPLDCAVLILFALLNTLNLKIGSSIQYSFIFLKFIPILFVILTGFFFAQGSSFAASNLRFSGIPSSIPLVLYAFTGFEASCSLSRHIIDPKKNGPRAILISFSIVLISVVLYQFLFYATVGPSLGRLPGGYLDALPAFLSKLPLSSWYQPLQNLLHLAIASSSLGSAYGMMFSNGWNLFTLAQKGHISGSALFTHRNQYGMPLWCITAEVVIALFYIIVTQGNQLALQQVSALGGTIAYTLSSLSLLLLSLRKNDKLLLPLAGLGSCLILISSFIWTIAAKGPTSLLLIFLALIAGGSFMFYAHTPLEELDAFEKL